MFQGSMVALVTPMTADNRLDFEALDRLVEFHLANGTDAIVAVGTSGESATLGFDEHSTVVKAVVDRVRGRVPVIAGTGANSTAEALHLSRCARDAGADACLLVTPYYNKPTQEGMYQHFKLIAQEIAIPHILYNVPGRTAIDLLPDTVERLSRIPNIVGIKEASTLERCQALLGRCDGQHFAILSGEDPIAAEVILQGGKGIISVTANVAPQAMHDLCEAALAGDRQRALAIDANLRDLHKALFLESNPIPVKWAVQQLGLIDSGIRLPLTPLSEALRPQVLDAMRVAGVL